MPQPITVIKRNAAGVEVFRYEGIILHTETDAIVLEAYFNRPDMLIMDTVWKLGDRFVETYYTKRWYNIFEIHDREDDRIKGWYCNIGKPVVREAENIVSYVDLALDLWVAPDGTQTVLDEDEFAALHLDAETEAKARAALEELQNRFEGMGRE
ncbi:MAG: DUF402 domain-containing protein [Anaerolineales bacterium]